MYQLSDQEASKYFSSLGCALHILVHATHTSLLDTNDMVKFISLYTSSICMLIIFANSLDTDQAGQNVGPDLYLNCLTP